MSKALVTAGQDLKEFSNYLAGRKGALQAVSASHMNADRLLKIVLGCVMRVPLLRQCTTDSLFRSTMMAAELGLEPGSALGEGYLVPFKNNKINAYEAQFMPGYRGLVGLAFKSGFVIEVYAKEVYKDDSFTYKMGLDRVLDHIPGDGEHEPSDITHAYMVARLKGGGLVMDVMTRKDIERIRARSRAGTSGPWMTDYAEMCKKTVLKRGIKLVPMSVEMSKAQALDTAIETGDLSGLEFDFIDVEAVEDAPEAQEQPNRGTNTVKDKLAQQGEPLEMTGERYAATSGV